MKLLIVTPYFYPKIGGVENYVLNLALGLKKKYHWEIVIITSGDYKHIKSFKGLKIYHLPYWIKISNTPVNPLWYFQIKKIIQSENPDVINAHTPVPFMADISSRVKGRKKFLLTHHNDLVKSNWLQKNIINLFYLLFGYKTLDIADKVIATSRLYLEKSKYLNKHKAKTHIITPGVDTKVFNSKNKSNKVNKLYSKNKVVLFVGNLDKTHYHKGLSIVIESINSMRKMIPNVKLVVIGKGDGLNDYKQLVKSYNLSDFVDFLPKISTSKLPFYYNASDVLVLPSINNSEGFGMVLIEANSCKKPVIGSRIGGIPYVIDDGKNGILVEPSNSKSLSNAIIKILTNKDIAHKMGKNGYEKVKKYFSLDNQIKNTYKLFNSL